VVVVPEPASAVEVADDAPVAVAPPAIPPTPEPLPEPSPETPEVVVALVKVNDTAVDDWPSVVVYEALNRIVPDDEGSVDVVKFVTTRDLNAADVSLRKSEDVDAAAIS
jgi:hypothetical protein